MSVSLQALVVEYRSPQRTIACVAALLGQGVPLVQVVDNSADDGRTRAQLEVAFGGDSRVRILDAGGNLGFAAGVNLGLRHRACERVLLINNDAVPGPGTAMALNAALDADAGACLAFPSLMHAGHPVEHVFYHRWLALLVDRPCRGAFEVPRGCCMLVALDRIPAEPLFDERFFMYGEEIALGWRLHRSGARMIHVDAAWVEHEGSAAAVRGSPFYEERTALAHLLLSGTLARGPIERKALVMVRTQLVALRALVRALRQLSGLPLHAFARAMRMARNAESGLIGTPPPR